VAQAKQRSTTHLLGRRTKPFLASSSLTADLARVNLPQFERLAEQFRAFHQRDSQGNFLANTGVNSIDSKLYEALPARPEGITRASLGNAQAHLGGSQGISAAGQGTALESWAKANRLFVEKLPERWQLNSGGDDGGNEHHSFFDPESSRWVKITRGGEFGMVAFGRESNPNDPRDEGGPFLDGRSATPAEYLSRLSESNRAIGDDIRFHGAYRDETGLHAIISQPDVSGEIPTVPKIEKAMEQAGYVALANGAFYRASEAVKKVEKKTGPTTRYSV